MRWRTRSSRATMSITATLPPWLLSSTILRTPERATQAPISHHIAISVPAEWLSTPG